MIQSRIDAFFTFYQQAYPGWYLEIVLDSITMETFIFNSAPILDRLLSRNKDDKYCYPFTSDGDVFSSIEIPDFDSSWKQFIRKIYNTPHLINTDWCAPRLNQIDSRAAFECVLDKTFPGFSRMSWILSEEEYDRFVSELDVRTMNESTKSIDYVDDICYKHLKTRENKIHFHALFCGRNKEDTLKLVRSLNYNHSDLYEMINRVMREM